MFWILNFWRTKSGKLIPFCWLQIGVGMWKDQRVRAGAVRRTITLLPGIRKILNLNLIRTNWRLRHVVLVIWSVTMALTPLLIWDVTWVISLSARFIQGGRPHEVGRVAWALCSMGDNYFSLYVIANQRVKWLPSPIDICGTVRTADALQEIVRAFWR